MVPYVKSVKVHTDNNLDTITISSKPEAFSIIFFIAFLIGLCSLPFTEYRNDYIAYISMLFPIGLAAYYFVISIQSIKFENKTTIRIRKGFDSWNIPFKSVTGGYTSYKKVISQSSLQITHYLNFELKVNLPDNKKHWIRNGTANIFHYGFSQWGKEQEKIWEKFNDILNEKDIPNFTPK
jgi:hypothetical protein